MKLEAWPLKDTYEGSLKKTERVEPRLGATTYRHYLIPRPQMGR